MGNEEVELKKLDEQVYCSVCLGKRNHLIVLTHKRQSNDYDNYHWRIYFHIVQCAGCDNISFVEQHSNEDTWRIVDEQMEHYEEFTVYPEEPKLRDPDDPFSLVNEIKIKNFRHAPLNLKNLYIQIAESFNNNHYILATFGLRALIEGICSERKIKKGFLYEDDRTKKLKDGKEIKTDSLSGRIFGMYENGYILFPNALILLQIKNVGDSALHEIEIPDFFKLYQMISIIENVMNDVYELHNHSLITTGKKAKNPVIGGNL